MIPDAFIDADKTHGDAYYYGSAWQDDFLLRNPDSLPRYGRLARKALMHYAGDRYNPEVDGIGTELFIREIIYEVVSYKVLYRTKEYDWEWIDHVLRRAIGGCLQIDLPYDDTRIKAGFQGEAKAAQLMDWSFAI